MQAQRLLEPLCGHSRISTVYRKAHAVVLHARLTVMILCCQPLLHTMLAFLPDLTAFLAVDAGVTIFNTLSFCM